MRLGVVQRILGLLLMLFSFTMLPPALVSYIYQNNNADAFIYAFAFTVISGMLFWLPARNQLEELRLRDGFLIVAAFWFGLGSFGALPFLFIQVPEIHFTDALFESMSGLTTTGATILSNLDGLPESLLYYRQQLQWLGGMGIIVLAVAVLPMLGVGGMQLYRAEIAGPVKDTKLTPRITETAKALWYIYLGLTIICGISYFIAGMNIFDAVCHAFSTVSIGGFSTHDDSIGYFDSTMINTVAIIFMFLAGINFSLHFLAWRNKRLLDYIHDSEFRMYARVLLVLSVVVCVYLYSVNEFNSLGELINQGIFQVVSISTTTGFTTTNFSNWPGAIPVILIFSSFIGACAGSTGGGMKVMRVLLLYRQGLREIKRLVHPNAEIPVKLGGTPVPSRVIEAVWGFFAVYVAVFIVMMLMLLFNGVDQITAFSAIAASLNNLGPGLGEVAISYENMSNLSKWVCVAAMLLGRLEIFTLLVIISKSFWEI
ncbi:MAG: TrkH family potassium uptake protein [Pseudomonadota bacterium]|nr:TrkH family potassium uptake protein [Pseudomonadota bacterium]